MRAIEDIPLAEIEKARRRLRGRILRTPLIPLNVEDAPCEIHLKLESLQPIGSFKLRGAGNALAAASSDDLRGGVYTASAGNMAQGVAYNARRMGLECAVIVPEHAPETKCAAIRRLGGRVIKVPFDEWWRTLVEHGHPDQRGFFVHPVSDPLVIAGNGTIGLEIIEDLPDLEAVLAPYGGGGLSCGIAAAVKAVRPGVRVLACEVETAAPFSASLAKGRPATVEYRASFIDGIGAKSVLEEMWPLARRLLDGSAVVTLEQAAQALRLLAERNRVIAEGAGAVPVAAALEGKGGSGKVACVVSGGNIDAARLGRILQGGAP